MGVAVDILGHLLAVAVTPANEQDRAQVGQLAQAVQAAVDEPVHLAFVDQGYTGDQPAEAAAQEDIHWDQCRARVSVAQDDWLKQMRYRTWQQVWPGGTLA
jgi:transposase